MSLNQPKPLVPAFAHRMRTTMLAIIAVGAVIFAGLVEHLLVSHSRRHWVDQARLCAAALSPGEDGDIAESVARLQERYDGLIAVATLDALGQVRDVYPDRPGHRAALAAAYVTEGRSIAMSAPSGGTPIEAVGLVAALDGGVSPVVAKVLVLLQVHDPLIGLRHVTLIFAGVLAVAALVAVGVQGRWLDTRVLGPLRHLADSMGRREARSADPCPSGEWVETSAFVTRCHELLQDLTDNEARAEQFEADVFDEMCRRQRGFDDMLEQARHQASLDPVTALPNRTFLEEELEPLFNRWLSNDADLSAVMIDVDNLKAYNDGRGHQSGDSLLRFVGALLRGGIKPSDHAVRYGGDEFLMLMPDTSADEAAQIAERFVKLFGQYANCLGSNHNLSLSVGVASLRNDGPANGHELVAQADSALYSAKRRGKNSVVAHGVA